MKLSTFLEDLRVIIRREIRASNIDGVIQDVDKNDFTCSVLIPTTEAVFYKVPLRVLIGSQSSFIEIPKLKTPCVLTFRDMDQSRPQLLMVHESEEILISSGMSVKSEGISKMKVTKDSIIFDKGENGGMVKAKELKAQSEKDKQILDALLQVINGPQILEPGNGSPSAFQIALIAVLADKKTGEWDNLENEKIKQ